MHFVKKCHVESRSQTVTSPAQANRGSQAGVWCGVGPTPRSPPGGGLGGGGLKPKVELLTGTMVRGHCITANTFS